MLLKEKKELKKDLLLTKLLILLHQDYHNLEIILKKESKMLHEYEIIKLIYLI